VVRLAATILKVVMEPPRSLRVGGVSMRSARCLPSEYRELRERIYAPHGLDEAETWYRRAIDEGDLEAAAELTRLLDQHGRQNEAQFQ
jgi:hypothetical protein